MKQNTTPGRTRENGGTQKMVMFNDTSARKIVKHNRTRLWTTPEPEDADRRTNGGAAVPGWVGGGSRHGIYKSVLSAFSTQQCQVWAE